MKIFTMVSDQSSLIINDGFPVAQRFHKDKETGEKKFYPVGVYNLDKVKSQYFFLNKSLQDMINEEELTRIDNLIFKDHNNIAGLKIAFPSHNDSTALLVFDGYRRENVIFIENREFVESPCPYNSKIHRSYYVSADGEAHCRLCGEVGAVAKTEEEVNRYIEDLQLDKGIKPQRVMNKFFHLYNGDIRIYKESTTVKVEDFLDTFSVAVKDGETIQFLLNKKMKDADTGIEVDKQYIVEFTYVMGQKPNVAITLLETKGFTREQYNKIAEKANEFMESLKSPKEKTNVPTTSVFYFPDKSDEDDYSPFAGLKDMIDE